MTLTMNPSLFLRVIAVVSIGIMKNGMKESIAVKPFETRLLIMKNSRIWISMIKQRTIEIYVAFLYSYVIDVRK